jgi:hypothetical protein
MDKVSFSERSQELREHLASKRPLVGQTSISTHYYPQQQRWYSHYYLADNETVIAVPLDVEDPDDLSSVDEAELKQMTLAAPQVRQSNDEGSIEWESSEPCVYPDQQDKHWYLWVPCHQCHGFAFQLEIEITDLSALPQQLHRRAKNQEEMIARLLGYRVLEWFQAEQGPACAGCVTDLIEKDYAEMPAQPYLWLNVNTQQWQLWCPHLESSLDLKLPSYAPETDIQAAAQQLLKQQKAD